MATSTESTSWSTSQINLFARRFARSTVGKSWWAFIDEVREALVDALVVEILLGQSNDDQGFTVAQIRALRAGILLRLATHHGMRTEWSAEQVKAAS